METESAPLSEYVIAGIRYQLSDLNSLELRLSKFELAPFPCLKVLSKQLPYFIKQSRKCQKTLIGLEKAHADQKLYYSRFALIRLGQYMKTLPSQRRVEARAEETVDKLDRLDLFYNSSSDTTERDIRAEEPLGERYLSLYLDVEHLISRIARELRVEEMIRLKIEAEKRAKDKEFRRNYPPPLRYYDSLGH